MDRKFTKTSPKWSQEELSTITLDDLIDSYNDLQSKYEALLAKLDADAGVSDTDYASSLGGSSAAPQKPSDRLI